VPIWKRETWAEGSDWGLCAHDVRDVDGARPGADEAGSGRGGGTGVPTADGGPAPVSAPVEPV